MTLDEVERDLVNGLHDAALERLTIDYSQKCLTMELQVWLGDPDADTLAGRELMKPAKITLSGLAFCIIDPPDSRYPFEDRGPLQIDVGTGEPSTAPGAHPPVPTDAFLAWIFVTGWNAFIRVAARSAELEWVPEA